MLEAGRLGLQSQPCLLPCLGKSHHLLESQWGDSGVCLAGLLISIREML